MNSGKMNFCPLVDQVILSAQASQGPGDRWNRLRQQLPGILLSLHTSICQHKCVTIFRLGLSICRANFKLVLKVKIKPAIPWTSFFNIVFFFFPTRKKNMGMGRELYTLEMHGYIMHIFPMITREIAPAHYLHIYIQTIRYVQGTCQFQMKYWIIIIGHEYSKSKQKTISSYN